MLIKIYKNIHIKNSKLFKFFFYLTHILVLFLIAFSLFLSIPKFFDHQKKSKIINDYLISSYNLELNKLGSIEYKVFPYPNLLLKNISLKVKNKPIIFLSKNAKIFLNFQDIYNVKAINSKKIFIDNPSISLDIGSFKELINYFENLKNKFYFKGGDVSFLKNKDTLIKIKNLDYSNFGFKKNHLSGNLFDKKFKASLKGKNNDISFKILETGITATFIFDNINYEKKVSGASKINILNNFLKFNFELNNEEMIIKKLTFRNKDLSTSSFGTIKFNPFFSINSNIIIKKINKNLFDDIDLKKIFLNKEIIRKINGNSKIIYKEKKLIKNYLNNILLDFNLAYGRLDFSSEIVISGGKIICKGDSILTEDYPRLYFNCKFDIKDQKKLFVDISLPNNSKNGSFILLVDGNLNIFNKKVNFKNIKINNLYTATDEDLKFYKKNFELILFDKDFINIFDIKKIKKFLIEII